MRRHSAAQALVEFSLVAPILIFMILAVIQAGLLFWYVLQQQNTTQTIAASWAANGALDMTAIGPELERIGCESPAITTAPASPSAGEIATATVSCVWSRGVVIPIWADGLPVSTTASSVWPSAPSPSASPSVSP